MLVGAGPLGLRRLRLPRRVHTAISQGLDSSCWSSFAAPPHEPQMRSLQAVGRKDAAERSRIRKPEHFFVRELMSARRARRSARAWYQERTRWPGFRRLPIPVPKSAFELLHPITMEDNSDQSRYTIPHEGALGTLVVVTIETPRGNGASTVGSQNSQTRAATAQVDTRPILEDLAMLCVFEQL